MWGHQGIAIWRALFLCGMFASLWNCTVLENAAPDGFQATYAGPIQSVGMTTPGILEMQMDGPGEVFFCAVSVQGVFAAGASPALNGFNSQYRAFLPAGHIHRISLDELFSGVWPRYVDVRLPRDAILDLDLRGIFRESESWPVSVRDSPERTFSISAVISASALKERH